MSRLPPAAVLAADLAACLRFFTRLPIPRLSAADEPARLPDFRRTAWAVPAAGIVLALPAAAVGALLGASDLPPLIAGALTVAAMALVTGGLHEDGLADTADGLGGGMNRQRRLAIMRDSRIGVFGAAALVLALLVRATAYGALLAAAPLAGALAIAAAAAASRGLMVAVWSALADARPDGLAARAGRPSPEAAGLALSLAAVLGLLAGPAAGLGGLAAGLVLAAVAASSLAKTARRTIGGQTGDILGGVQQLAEIGFLVGLLL